MGSDNTPRVVRSDETLSTERTHRARAIPHVIQLVVVWPRDLVARHRLGDGDMVVGRQAAPGMVTAAHATVSRRHAAIRWDPAAGRHALTDLGSRNGTWLGGQPVAALPRYLEDGAVLRFGDVLAIYERRDIAVDDPPQVSRDAIPGQALAVVAVRAAVGRAGADPSPVLVLGETGAGKERIAGELHRLSGRRGPLITINCAALSPQIVESQLFGHVRGAFTGATSEHLGLFRAATGGTLFLDELGELPLELQPKLLRAVELGEVVAVGSTQRHRVDVRLVGATNRSLVDDVERGRFRRDLYARLALWEVHVPPLRARRPDIVEWIDRLHRAWCEPRGRVGAPPIQFTAEAVEQLLLSSWPDNLRGLQRFVHELGPVAGEAPADLSALPPWISAAPGALTSSSETPPPPREPDADARPNRTPRARPTREELIAALAAHGWSIRATAKYFDRDRKQISRWIEMYAIDVPSRPET